ncbi:MAG: DUF5915 domain-containing protein [Litorilinea sp.]
MATQQNQSSGQTNFSELELHNCAKALVQAIQQMRKQADYAADQTVSVYLTDKPIIRRMLKVHREYVTEQANAADVVQINLDANIPIPKHAPQQDFEIGGQTVRIAIKRD